MDQIYQLQRQIQELRNELQRMQQHESAASQQLNTIQQLCHHLSQDVNAISNATQQVTSQMFNRPVSSGQFGAQTLSQPVTGQYGAFAPSVTSLYSPSQFGAYGAQFSPYMTAGTTSRFGQSFNIPDYTATQQYQAVPFTSNVMPGGAANVWRTNINPVTSASNIGMTPSFTSQQFGSSGLSSGMAGSAYLPHVSGQISSMPATGLLSSQAQLSAPSQQWSAAGQTQLSTPIQSYMPAHAQTQLSAPTQLSFAGQTQLTAPQNMAYSGF